jgi:hypothetical protein
MRRTRIRTGLDALLIGAFGIGLLAPAVDIFARPDSVRSAKRENRTPARFPEPIRGVSTLSKYAHDFESWFNDCFGLRDVMLRGHQSLRYFVFHSEASPTLIEGKGNWLYFGADQSVPVLRGVQPFSRDELERWRVDIEARRDWLRTLGIEYVFVIAPNKQSVYPENMPGELRQLGPTRLDQLAAYMKLASDARFLDLRAALIAEKSHDSGDDCVYYPLGSHWAWRGGWIAWNEIVRSLHDVLPTLRSVPREALGHAEVSQQAGDSMALNTYIDDLVRQRTFTDFIARPSAVIERTPDGGTPGSVNPDTSLPKTLVLHDSFGAWLLPFAAEGSSRMKASWQHSFPKELIQREHPDVVVQMYTERVLVWGLSKLAPENDPLDAAAFEALPKLWSSTSAWAATVPSTEGGISVVRKDDGFEVEQTSDTGVILLPSSDVPAGAQLALHIDVDAPEHTVLTFFYQLSHDRTFARTRAAMVTLEAGRNDVRFRLRMPDVWGPIKLRIGSAKGRYVLHSVEARVAR